MSSLLPILLAQAPEFNWAPWAVAVVVFGLLLLAVLVIVMVGYGNLWFQAYMSGADVSMLSLMGMSFRQVDARLIVRAKIMAMQAGLGTEQEIGITTRRLEAHYLAGGNVPNVIMAIIAAHRADIDLDFDKAAAIDLAGRDVLDAVQTSVNPQGDRLSRPHAGRRRTRSAPLPRTAWS